MLNGNLYAARRMPKRIVVELTAEEWEVLEARCGRLVTPSMLIRAVTLRLARS